MTTAAVILRYFQIVANLASTQEELDEVLHPNIYVLEHPNAMNPSGAERDRDHLIAGFLAGKDLLASQSIDILDLMTDGDRAAVRATWRATTKDGTEFVAHIAGWLRVEDDRIVEHETFDCYEPLRPGS